MAALGAGGCGGAVEGEGSPVPLAEFPSEFASALCQTYAGCCQQAGLPFAYAQCFSGYTAEDNFTHSVVSERYDPALARRCIDTMVRTVSSCLEAARWSPEWLKACDPLFPTLPTISEERGAIPSALGEACNQSCDRASCRATDVPKPWRVCLLEEGLRCAEGGTCQPALKLGQACDDNYGCAIGLLCVDGQCIERHDTGPCPNNSYCSAGSTCRAGQCVPNSIVSPAFCAFEP